MPHTNSSTSDCTYKTPRPGRGACGRHMEIGEEAFVMADGPLFGWCKECFFRADPPDYARDKMGKPFTHGLLAQCHWCGYHPAILEKVHA